MPDTGKTKRMVRKMEFRTNGTAEVSRLCDEGGVSYYLIKAAENADAIRVEWARPMADHVSVWHPMCGRHRALPQWFCAQKTESCFYRGAPVLATVKADGTARETVALQDAETLSKLSYWVDDFYERDEVIFAVDIYPAKKPYSCVLRIDESGLPLEDAIKNVAGWWNKGTEKTVPADAYAPLYSTWYNFHQEPKQDALTKELKIAASLGFKTVILDDGWQIEGKGTKDYLKSGDWLVAKDKFPDFRQFTADVHAFGLKLILWFSVPFVGYETQAYRRFANKLLYTEDGYVNAGILDIRYPEVRQYIVDTYIRFVRDYDIDGLKLDFIDSFYSSASVPPCNPQMDCGSVGEAVTALLTQIKTETETCKPGFLTEFRQFYVGPSVLRFGNMIRVADCAFDSITNRIGIADLRMLTADTAVHSDMLLWSPEETPVNCALQMLNIMFGVPQISVLLGRSTPEQLAAVGDYLRYKEENREILLKGTLHVKHPELGYTAISSENEQKKITVLYGETACEFGGKTEDIWNAADKDGIVLLNREKADLHIRVFDFSGNPLCSFTSKEAACFVEVPLTGRVTVQKAE